MEPSNHHTRSQRSNFEQAVCRMRCVWEGLFQKQMPKVMFGIRKRKHDYLEDRVASSSKQVMNQTKKLRYECEWSEIDWNTIERAVFKLKNESIEPL